MPSDDVYRLGWVSEQEAVTEVRTLSPNPNSRPRRCNGWAEAGAEELKQPERRERGGAVDIRALPGGCVDPAEGAWGRGRPAPGGAARALQPSTRRRPLPSRRGPLRAVHVPVPRLRPLARSLLPALPAAPAEPASPQSLMNIERPLLYFPSSIAEAEARHIVRRRRRPRRLVPASWSGRGQRSPGLGQEPVSGAGGEENGAGTAGRDARRPAGG